jgi:hypothetical protein
MTNLYYKPSGKFNPISFLYLILAICIAAPILALIYTYATLYIPLIYLNFLCLAGIAFGLGFTANFVVGFGKVRNKLLAIVIGLLVAFAGFYFSWVIWICHHFEMPYLEIIQNPEAMMRGIGFANDEGTWGFRSGGNVDKTMLSIVWAIEAIGIIGVPVFFAYTKACEPFIENDDNWAEDTFIGPFELIVDKTTLIKQLEAKNYDGLLAIAPAENAGQGSHTLFQLYHAENRNQAKEFYLTINNMIEKLDKDGNLDFDEKALVSFIHISKDAGQQLLAKIATDAAVVEN